MIICLKEEISLCHLPLAEVAINALLNLNINVTLIVLQKL